MGNRVASFSSSRDSTDLRRDQLLDDYLAIARKRGDALVATALRTKSVDMRDILVHGSIHQAMTSERLKAQVLSETFCEDNVVDVGILGDLGRLVLLQNLKEDDLTYGERLLTYAHSLSAQGELSLDNRRVLIQHHISLGNRNEAAKLLDDSPDIDKELWSYLRAELNNPFVLGNAQSYDEWLSNFNELFVAHDLAAVSLADSDRSPFERLMTSTESKEPLSCAQGPLVSVILTTYKPDENHLVSAVLSILEQTWENIEVLIVDDCSGTHYYKIIHRVAQMDSRIRVIHASENGGTYAARNLGFAASSGEFITAHDVDEWSHPERIARQLQFMDKHSKAIGCRITAIRCDESLNRSRVGFSPTAINPSSLLIRREGYELVGGYLETREDGDSEYYYRLASGTGRPVSDLKAPLSLVRVVDHSLSRNDLSAGWRLQSRNSFMSAYRYWHRNSFLDELIVGSGQIPRVKIPRRFESLTDTEAVPDFDVVIAGDWQRYGGPQKSMLEEIYALLGANFRVGILNLEAARFMSEGTSEPLNNPVQKLINDGLVDELFYDDDVRIRLLILRYPPILQFFAYEASSLRVESMMIVANQAPSEHDGSDIRYLVGDCDANAEAAFRVSPVWVPQGPQVRDFLQYYLNSPELAEFDLPGIVDINEWWHRKLWYRSTVPVVGRHSRDDAMKWPAERESLEEVYRPDGEYDVRIMGGHKIALRVIGSSQVPAGWTVYKKDEMPVPDFLYSLDYFVFFQHPQAVEAFGRAILEALASGTVVILPKHFQRVFGDAALYSDPSEVAELIAKMHSDFSIYTSQLEHSESVLKKYFSYESYNDRIRSFLRGERMKGIENL